MALQELIRALVVSLIAWLGGEAERMAIGEIGNMPFSAAPISEDVRMLVDRKDRVGWVQSCDLGEGQGEYRFYFKAKAKEDLNEAVEEFTRLRSRCLFLELHDQPCRDERFQSLVEREAAPTPRIDWTLSLAAPIPAYQDKMQSRSQTSAPRTAGEDAQRELTMRLYLHPSEQTPPQLRNRIENGVHVLDLRQRTKVGAN